MACYNESILNTIQSVKNVEVFFSTIIILHGYIITSPWEVIFKWDITYMKIKISS